jgi:tape measure domain-containing protein
MASKLAQGYVDIRVRLESLVNDLNTAQAKVNSSLQQIESRSQQSSATVGNTMTAILGSQALRYLGQQVREVGEALIWSNAQFEDFDFALSKLTGSAERGAQMMKELKDFAISTPFNLTTLMKGTQQLLAFGYATEDVIPLLRSLGDVAASMPEGANDGIERMIGALAQMRNKQKVQAMEMNRLARAGVPMWDALAAVMGTTMPNAMAKVHSGTVSATIGMKALALVAADPRFAGAMEGRAKLFSGLMSNLQDIAWQQAAEIGKPLFEVVKASMEHLFSFLRSDAGQNLVATFTMIVGKIADIIRPLSPILLSVAAPLTLFAAALGGIGLIAPLITAGLSAITAGLSLMFSPMGMLIGALSTLAYALVRAFQDPTYGRPLRAAIMQIWDVAKKFGAGFMASWSMIQDAATDLLRFLMVAWTDFFGGVATFAQNNQESFQMWGVFIGEIVAGTIKVITQFLRTFWNFARDLWQQYGDKVALVWYWTSLVISNVLEEISVTLNNFNLTSRLIWVQFQIGMLKLFDWIAMKFWEMTAIGLGAVFALGLPSARCGKT